MLWQKLAVYLQCVHRMAGSAALPLLWCFETVFGCVAVMQQRVAAAESRRA